MAGEVKVSFVGSVDDLSNKLDTLERNVEDTSREIEKAARSSASAGRSLEGLRDGAGNTERRFIGLKDSMTGTGDVMKGLKDGDVLALSMGFADLAGAVENLGADLLEWGKKAFEGAKHVVEAHAASVVAKAKDVAATVAHKAASIASTVATQAQAAAQWALNAAMSANPIVLVVAAIAALTAGVILAYKNSETFRNIVDSIGRFFRDELWPAIHAVAEKVVEFGTRVAEIGSSIAQTIAGIVIKFWQFVGEVRDVVKAILDAFKDVGEKILAPFEWAFGKIKAIYDHSIGPIIDAIKGIGPGNGGFGGGLDPDKVRADLERKAGAPSGSAGYGLTGGAGYRQPVVMMLNDRVLGEVIVDLESRWSS